MGIRFQGSASASLYAVWVLVELAGIVQGWVPLPLAVDPLGGSCQTKLGCQYRWPGGKRGIIGTRGQHSRHNALRMLSSSIEPSEKETPPGRRMVRGGGGFPSCPPLREGILTARGRALTTGKGSGESLLLTDKRTRMREIFDAELEMVAGAR